MGVDPQFNSTPSLYFIILCLLGFLCMAYILSPFCSFQTSSPALCGPTSLMYGTPIYEVWLTSCLTLSLVPERIIPRSPISTVSERGRSWASMFSEITVLPAATSYVALYLFSVLQASTSPSLVQSAFYSIRLTHDGAS